MFAGLQGSKNRDAMGRRSMNDDTRYWIIPREGRIELRELSPADVLALEARGYERFILGRGKFSPIEGFAENPADVGEIRRLLNQQDDR
jgi:hypothetical protein